MSLSVKGIARHFLSQSGVFSVRQVFFDSAGGSLQQQLETLARTEITVHVDECVYGWTASYQQIWSRINVRVRLNFDPGIPAATMTTLQATWENGIENMWSNRWSIGHAGEISCPLEFNVDWVNNNQHHTVRVQSGPARSNMTLWDTADTGAVAAHEFGHMLGNPDEYTDSACPSRSPVNTNTIMDNNSNNLPQRLMERFADEVGSNVVV